MCYVGEFASIATTMWSLLQSTNSKKYSCCDNYLQKYGMYFTGNKILCQFTHRNHLKDLSTNIFFPRLIIDHWFCDNLTLWSAKINIRSNQGVYREETWPCMVRPLNSYFCQKWANSTVEDGQKIIIFFGVNTKW